jgi:hypothetical protein
MDVRQEQVAEVGELEPALGEPLLQRGDAGRGAAVEQRRSFRRVEEVDADHALAAEVQQVERLEHASILER